MKRTFDIAVVGAGPVGAAAAVGLAGLGCSVALVDAAEAVPVPTSDDEYDLRVFAVSPASQRLLARLGAWERIAGTRVSPYRRMEVNDGIGELVFDAADVAEPELGHIIENRLIQGALHERAGRMEQLHWFAPDTVEQLELGEEINTIRLSQSGRLRARLVLAADGARSRLREMAGLDVVAVDHQQSGVVGHVHTEQPHGETARQRFLENGPLAFLPLIDGRSSIVWSTTPEHAESLLADTPEAVGEALTEASGRWLGRVTPDTRLVAFPLVSRYAPQYITQRFALLGDAAHTIHPLAGLGMNMGLKDVNELLEQVASARARGHDPGERLYLRRYERARKPDNRLMLHLLDGFNRLFRLRQPGVDQIRGLGMHLFDASGPLKREVIRRAMWG